VLLVALVALLAAPSALASAGGGSSGFSGGDGGGGFSGGGGAGRGFALYVFIRLIFVVARIGHGLGLLILIALALVYYFWRRGMPTAAAFFEARSRQGRAHRRETRVRQRKVELAAAEAADEDPVFGPEHVRAAAGALFIEIQFAWSAEDRLALRRLITPALLEEWERRLDGMQARGWHNRVQPIGEPTVEYIGIRRDGRDRVVVRIEAKLRDFVVDNSGRHIKRSGSFTETVRLREYWTLERRNEQWVLASIEQGAEGAHMLTDTLAPTAWSDEQRLRDEAMLETAAAVPEGVRLSDLINVEFGEDVRSTAADLSLADDRFSTSVLEVAARRAVTAWAEAVDGPDTELRKLADREAVLDLLHPGDPSARTRLVVRAPQVKRVAVVAIDASADPATMTIDVEVEGRRYVEDRGTTRVLAGDANRVSTFTERWTLALTADPAQPWRIRSVQTPTPAA
jgi:predicted lipid-binding transport protein (Tim44 family)